MPTQDLNSVFTPVCFHNGVIAVSIVHYTGMATVAHSVNVVLSYQNKTEIVDHFKATKVSETTQKSGREVLLVAVAMAPIP